jgi:hypothetical protein
VSSFFGDQPYISKTPGYRGPNMVVEVIEHSFLEASKTNACPNRSICLIAQLLETAVC